MTEDEIILTVTPAMAAAFDRVRRRQDKTSSLTQVQLGRFLDTRLDEAKTVEYSTLRTLSRLHKELFPPDAASPSEFAASGYLQHLLRGSELVTKQPPAGPSYTPEFAAELQRKRQRHERREYLDLVRDLPQRADLAGGGMSGPLSGFSQVTKDLSVGLNVILVMFTGFMVFYYAGNMLFPHNKVYATGLGAIGLIAALLLETFVLLLRDRKELAMDERRERDRVMGIRADVGPARFALMRERVEAHAAKAAVAGKATGAGAVLGQAGPAAAQEARAVEVVAGGRGKVD